MTTDFPPSKTELLETFEDLQDWQDRYEYILDIARELPKLAPEHQTEENKVHGCMSTVWLVVNGKQADDSTQKIELQADSDSMIVRGLVVILLTLYDNKTPAEAIEQDPEAVYGTLGLNQHLSPNRRNGLYSMINRIRELCVKLEAER